MRIHAVAVLAIGSACLASQAVGRPAMEAKAQIQALEDRFAAAVNARDLDAIMKVYAPGQDLFVFDVVPPRQYAGWDAYKKDWKGFLDTLKEMKFQISDLDINSDGTIGYSHSIQHMTTTDTKGKPTDLTVRVTDVYRKVDGKWLIVQEHVSVPVDIDKGKPDLTSSP